jgi:uncharacterized protein (TIGR00290 family)
LSKEKIVFSWSGGKDSALALHETLRSGRYEVSALLTTVTRAYQRICMHGVRESLLEDQARALGIPCDKIYMSDGATNQEYETKLREALEAYKARGIRRVAFGDIFLEDLKAYRDKNLAAWGMEGIYPIWKRDSRRLILDFVSQGFKGVLVCIDQRVLPKSWAGRAIDEAFLGDLPAGVDPCGENGEYHTFVFDGPIFQDRISIVLGEQVVRAPFVYQDVLPGGLS